MRRLDRVFADRAACLRVAVTRGLLLLTVAAVVGLAGQARADAPALLPAQGVLLDNAGLPVGDGQYHVVFALYGASAGGTALWSESWPPAGQACDVPGACVATQGGAFSVLLGTHAPLPPALFATAPELWLGIAVEVDPELPRRRVASSAYAFRATSAATADAAGALTCTGCVAEGALGFPVATANAGGAALTAVSASELSCTGCVTAAEVSFPWAAGVAAGGDASGLQCSGCVSFAELDDAAILAIQNAYTDDMAIAAVEQDGFMRGTDPVAPAQLPPDGLDEVSGGLVTTQFQHSYVKDGPIAIPDFAPPFPVLTATLDVPSVGLAETLTVQIHVQHADVGQLVVTLKSPQGVSIVLHNQGAAGTTTLYTAYPSPTKPASGDLGQFLGTDLVGIWTLEVADKVAGGSGTLESFWMHIGVRSADTVGVNGNLDVSGALTVGGKVVAGGVPTLDCMGIYVANPPLTATCPAGKTIVSAFGVGDITGLSDCVGKSTCALPAAGVIVSCCSLAP